jgi:hypothetical protein
MAAIPPGLACCSVRTESVRQFRTFVVRRRPTITMLPKGHAGDRALAGALGRASDQAR